MGPSGKQRLTWTVAAQIVTCAAGLAKPASSHLIVRPAGNAVKAGVCHRVALWVVTLLLSRWCSWACLLSRWPFWKSQCC